MSRVELELDDVALARLADLVAERLDARGSEPWVGVREAAAHLACKPQRIYDLVHRGAIPHRKENSRLLFRLVEIDDWLEAPNDA
jgi:excisionase family DNA binding protein